MKNETNAPADQQPDIKIPYTWSPTGFINLEPIIRVITKETGPDNLSRILEGVINDLTSFYLITDRLHNKSEDYILHLRTLRNAFTRSMGLFCLDGPTEEEEAWREAKEQELYQAALAKQNQESNNKPKAA